MPSSPWDNIFWHALSGTQAHLACGTDTIRRVLPGYSAMIAMADPLRPDWAAIRPFCAPGERLYCSGWQGEVAAGWELVADTHMCLMRWDGVEPEPDAALVAVPLGAVHLPQVLDLVAATKPGPFGPRTIEMGEYFGVFEDGRLLAMAGERLHAGALREVSGVCTDPAFQGRGLARRLMNLVIRRQLRRGQTPFLHVASSNARARALYERMGFRVEREVALRVVVPLA
ncbi:MAG: GNAT family N-acetyltransferase [Gammaproteobacteria bacterium HGW-Gammaproteobacteria-4]|jgi:ribosomal protein S18 acetylase RimI-like enzyme|nr:MAG: GNAT family N-acetyltransferase [Gammaproteobacteria bacterium HGW-Gammaproteobacteria-4]